MTTCLIYNLKGLLKAVEAINYYFDIINDVEEISLF